MIISNIKKDYGTHSSIVLYTHPFEVTPPRCSIHHQVSCQICFTRGKLNKDLDTMTPDEKKHYFSNRKSSTRRAKTSVTDYALCNNFSQFITLTFDPKIIDSMDYDLCKKRVSKWINNQRRHSPNLTYILVAEKHKKGAIHFHMIVNNFYGNLSEAHNKKTKRKLIKNGKQIYNLDGWKYGFSTLSYIKNKEATARYLQKYLTKDFIEAFNKKRFWTSRGLNKPVKSMNIDVKVEVIDVPPLFKKLFRDENYYQYTIYPSGGRAKSLKQIRENARRLEKDLVRRH